MNFLVAVDENNGIGFQNKLLYRIPEDLKRFQALTTGNIIVMGRKTLESFPNSSPLPNRVNVVFTHNPNYQKKDCLIVHSLEEFFSLSRSKNWAEENIFIIGGAEIYKLFLPYCDKVCLTKITPEITKKADAFFPEAKGFTVQWKSDVFAFEEGKFQFLELVKTP